MKKTKLTRSLLAACSIVALSAVMYGCVHSGDGPALSMLDLTGVETQAGASNEAGTYSTDDVPAALLAALQGYTGTTMGDTGDMVMAGGYTFTCVAGPCSVTVSDDESQFTTTGTISVSSYMEPPPPMPDPAIAQRAAINTAIMAANTAVGMVDDEADDATVEAANDAIDAARKAISNATNVPADERAAFTGTVDLIQTTLTAAETSRTTAMMEANVAMGMAMYAALAGPTGGGTDNALANNEAAPTLATAGLTIDAAAGAGSLADDAAHAAVTLMASGSAGMLGDWAGTNYAHTMGTGDAMVTNEARVYTNQADSETTMMSFAEAGYVVATATSGSDIEGYLTLTTTDAATLGRIKADIFEHSGTQTHAIPDRSDALYVRGTYDGASGRVPLLRNGLLFDQQRQRQPECIGRNLAFQARRKRDGVPDPIR